MKFLNYFALLLYKSPMSAVGQNFEEILEEQHAEIDPATLQYLEQITCRKPACCSKYCSERA